MGVKKLNEKEEDRNSAKKPQVYPEAFPLLSKI